MVRLGLVRTSQLRYHCLWIVHSGTCDAHIGMGVRYNAEKKKIGMYYSTPIFSFRCKCHLCSGWFEIQTDPQVRPFVPLCPTWVTLALTRYLMQNTRYVVVSGARRKEEDWDPAENGGFAVLGLHISSFHIALSHPDSLNPPLFCRYR